MSRNTSPQNIKGSVKQIISSWNLLYPLQGSATWQLLAFLKLSPYLFKAVTFRKYSGSSRLHLRKDTRRVTQMVGTHRLGVRCRRSQTLVQPPEATVRSCLPQSLKWAAKHLETGFDSPHVSFSAKHIYIYIYLKLKKSRRTYINYHLRHVTWKSAVQH